MPPFFCKRERERERDSIVSTLTCVCFKENIEYLNIYGKYKQN